MNQFPATKSAQVTLANWRIAPFNQWAFHHVSELVPSAIIKNDPANIQPLARGRSLSLPDIEHEGVTISSEQLVQQTHTDGLVVLHDGKLIYETYNTMTADDPHILMSVSKSMLGLLTGILAEKNLLDVNATLETYLPELKNTGFAGASLQQLLDMRTGVAFDEDYLATEGSIVDYRKATNWNPLEIGDEPTDLRSFFSTLSEKDQPHGGNFDYKSPCTDLLGWVLERATGQRYADLFSQHLWSVCGAEQPAMITVDRLGAPRVAGGMSMTTRDLARIGQLMADDGAGIVPSQWIDDIATNGDAEAWTNGSFAAQFPGIPMHYRSKWYVLRGESPILFCLGIHGQNLFVDRQAKIVMAKQSSAPEALNTSSEIMMMNLFKTVRSKLA